MKNTMNYGITMVLVAGSLACGGAPDGEPASPVQQQGLLDQGFAAIQVTVDQSTRLEGELLDALGLPRATFSIEKHGELETVSVALSDCTSTLRFDTRAKRATIELSEGGLIELEWNGNEWTPISWEDERYLRAKYPQVMAPFLVALEIAGKARQGM